MALALKCGLALGLGFSWTSVRREACVCVCVCVKGEARFGWVWGNMQSEQVRVSLSPNTGGECARGTKYGRVCGAKHVQRAEGREGSWSASTGPRRIVWGWSNTDQCCVGGFLCVNGAYSSCVPPAVPLGACGASLGHPVLWLARGPAAWTRACSSRMTTAPSCGTPRRGRWRTPKCGSRT